METFTELDLSAPILRAIKDLGFEKPSPIQAETLPILLGANTDFLGLAATGTGKTAAFGIPMLEKIDASQRKVQALILCPTRELALQVSGQITLLGKHKGVQTVAVYGGSSYADQIYGLRQGASVVVGTPGRIVDHIERGTLKLGGVKVVILDEADEMISMGFKEDMEKILGAALDKNESGDEPDVEDENGDPIPKRQVNVWLFSATMSREVRKVADAYLNKPQQVHVNRKEMLSSTVEQYYYPTQESDKPEILCKLIEAADDFYGLVFCQTKSLVIDLTQYLNDKGYKTDCLHGDKDQSSRERTMQAFRDHKVRILVCTDVASRGLDVKDITHVINYSLPRELDNYVHRIGRTARSGKAGIAMALVTASHRRLIYQIEQLTKTRMLEGKIPSRREIGARKVAKLLATFQDQPFHSRAAEVMNDEWKAALSEMSAEEVASRFVTMLMPDVFAESTHAKRPALAVRAPTAERPPTSERGQRRQQGFSRSDERSDRPRRFEQRGPSSDSRPAPPPRPRASGVQVEARPHFDERPRREMPSTDERPRRATSRAERSPMAPRASLKPREFKPRVSSFDADQSPRREMRAGTGTPKPKVAAPKPLASSSKPLTLPRAKAAIESAEVPVRESAAPKRDRDSARYKPAPKKRLRELAADSPLRHMDPVEKALITGPNRQQRRAAQFAAMNETAVSGAKKSAKD